MKSPLFVSVALLALAGLLALALWETGYTAGSPESPTTQGLASELVTGGWKPTLLIPSPDVFDFGKVHQGERREASFTLTNPTSEPVDIAEIKSSLPLPGDRIGVEESRACGDGLGPVAARLVGRIQVHGQVGYGHQGEDAQRGVGVRAQVPCRSRTGQTTAR